MENHRDVCTKTVAAPLVAEQREAPLWRRFAAIFYDSLLLVALWFLAAVPIVIVAGDHQPTNLFRWALRLYLLLVSLAFFGRFWTRGGQTLGMRAWHLQVIDEAGGRVRWLQAIRRWFIALLSWTALGLGFWWALFDRQGRTWHDRGSHTRLIVRPKGALTNSRDAAQQIKRDK